MLGFIPAVFNLLGTTWGTITLLALAGAVSVYIWENGLRNIWNGYRRWEKKRPPIKRRNKRR